jgi:hypothetical protein
MSIEINGIELPEHVSYSSFTTWLDCGFKYYLSRVLIESGSPSWWLAGGSAVHTASEVFDKAYFEEEGK